MSSPISSPTTSGATVIVERDAAILRLTLNRPEKLNSFTLDMHRELRDALATAADPDCRVVVLTGAGRAFSAGQDLAETTGRQTGAMPDAGLLLEKAYNPLITAITALDKPVIAAVNGIAAGAAANIALACDIVYAARSASFLQAFARIGLIPDAGGTWQLPRLAGGARARGMAMLAEPVPAETAKAWGMIWEVVDDDKLQATVDAVARKLAAAPTFALGLAKKALAASTGNTLAQQLEVERDFQKMAGASPDANEGVRAFVEKRAPRFTGRSA